MGLSARWLTVGVALPIMGIIVVGLVVGGLTHLVFRQKFAVALVAAAIGTAAHYNFDAPIARKLSELGL